MGTVRRLSSGKYQLHSKMFRVRSRGDLPYEPHAQILARATISATQQLGLTKSDKHCYWISTDSNYLREDKAAAFCAFAKRQSFSQIMQLDDWIESNGSPRQSKSTSRRNVGAALITWVYDPEAP
jgi:hypothetical protein